LGRPRGREPRITLADVARRAGVSTTTASFVLSGRTDMRISTRTADSVRQAARVMDYRPRVGGRVHLAEKAPAVGFISDTIASEPFAGELIRGGIAEAARQGHTVVVAETGGAPGLEASLVQELLDAGVEQFVYAATATRVVRLPDPLLARQTVLVNCIDRRWRTPAVVPDDRSAGALAARTLLDAGHREGIWLAGEVALGPYAGRDRKRGIDAHLHAHGVEVARHVSCSWWPPDTREAMIAELAGADAPPTGVIAMNDRVAMGVYQAVSEAGLRVPDDVSVVSFDNSDLAWWLAPGLTSIGLPYFDMGRRAVELVLGAEPRGRLEKLPMPMFDRGSVAGPAA
jgi:LacI family transcriptional regulator